MVNFAPSAVRYREGTHRVAHPGETFERFAPLMPRCGITRIAKLTGLDRVGVPVYAAIRPNSKGLSTAQGKGLSDLAARASALMESLEGWHGERARSWAYVSTRDAEAETGIPVVDVAALPSRGGGGPQPHTRLNWVKGRSLLSNADVLVPYDSVSTDFTDGVAAPFARTTNGLASGNSWLEASLHALYELVERDAVTRAALPGHLPVGYVDLATVADDYCGELLDRVAGARMEVAVSRVTPDGEVPVFTAYLIARPESNAPPFGCFSGHGAHLDPGVALSRALTEAIQSRATVISGSRDDLWPSTYERVLDRRTANAWFAWVSERSATLDFGAVPDRSSDDLGTDLQVALSLVGGRALDVVVADLTQPELSVPVVKVVAPGLLGLPYQTVPYRVSTKPSP